MITQQKEKEKRTSQIIFGDSFATWCS